MMSILNDIADKAADLEMRVNPSKSAALSAISLSMLIMLLI